MGGCNGGDYRGHLRCYIHRHQSFFWLGRLLAFRRRLRLAPSLGWLCGLCGMFTRRSMMRRASARSGDLSLDSDFTAPSIPEEIFEPLCSAVGNFALNFAFVDRALDYWIIVIYHDLGGKSVEKEIPRGFDRKLKFLRRCFKQIHALAPFATECLDCLEKAKALSNSRHYVVHGVLSDYIPEGHIFVFVNLNTNPSKTMHKLSKLSISAFKLLKQGNQCGNPQHPNARYRSQPHGGVRARG
jgi:hypothetical protein